MSLHSIDELGAYETAAEIDYILKATGYAKVNYIGYSLGTIQYFILLSARPEYNNKINRAAVLAPAPYCQDTHSPFFRLLTTLPDDVIRVRPKFIIVSGLTILP